MDERSMRGKKLVDSDDVVAVNGGKKSFRFNELHARGSRLAKMVGAMMLVAEHEMEEERHLVNP